MAFYPCIKISFRPKEASFSFNFSQVATTSFDPVNIFVSAVVALRM